MATVVNGVSFFFFFFFLLSFFFRFANITEPGFSQCDFFLETCFIRSVKPAILKVAKRQIDQNKRR